MRTVYRRVALIIHYAVYTEDTTSHSSNGSKIVVGPSCRVLAHLKERETARVGGGGGDGRGEKHN